MSVGLYLCELSGARILATTDALSQVGTDFQATLTTWDVVPSGEVGDNLLRSIDVSGSMSNGFNIGIIPIVDGEELTEQVFSGSGSGEWSAQAFVASRGARFAARIRTITRTGTVELHNVTCAFFPLRRVP